MKGTIKAALCAGIFSLGVVSTANATLETRLGGLAIYDRDLDISWLADANANGLMNWVDAKAWAAGLNVGGVTGWRLPTSQNNANAQMPWPCCTIPGSETGHLFYDELGGSTFNPILASGDPDLGLFSNMTNSLNWTGTEEVPFSIDAWAFEFNGGIRRSIIKGTTLRAMAVHSGDVGASSVPEPETITLMGLGLAGLLGFGRRQRRR